jgi:hypothetical protein
MPSSVMSIMLRVPPRLGTLGILAFGVDPGEGRSYSG